MKFKCIYSIILISNEKSAYLNEIEKFFLMFVNIKFFGIISHTIIQEMKDFLILNFQPK